MLDLCDGPACRLRAGDLDLTTAGVACLLRCETPVAARRLGRALVLAGGRLEPWSPPSLPPQPAMPVLLRDAGFADQPSEAAARRRGAWAAAETLSATAARELVAAVVRPTWTGPGAFAARVLGERDPHLVRAGESIAERAGIRVDAVNAARLMRAAQHGAEWLRRHATTLCAVSGDVLRPGLYELGDGASIAEALAAAGGVVDGVRVSTAGAVLADGVVTTDLAAAVPVALVAHHARREALF